MTSQERVYVLNGVNRKGEDEQQLFTHGEKELALHVAKRWHIKGLCPVMYSKTYRGDFKFWYDYQTAKLPGKPAKRKAA